MALIEQKYGGTSIGNPERIKNVARRVAKFKALGHQVVVELSAMSGETNRLIALAKKILIPLVNKAHVTEQNYPLVLLKNTVISSLS